MVALKCQPGATLTRRLDDLLAVDRGRLEAFETQLAEFFNPPALVGGEPLHLRQLIGAVVAAAAKHTKVER